MSFRTAAGHIPPSPHPAEVCCHVQTHYIREGTFVFLEGLMDEHVALELVFAVEGGVTHRALEGLLTWGQRPGLRDRTAT